MKKLTLHIIIDDDALKQSVRSKYLLFMRTVAPFVYVIYVVVYRLVLQSTQRSSRQSTQQKNGNYTVKNSVFTRLPDEEKERVGQDIKEPIMHSSTLVKCGNPDCDELFEYAKRGNQEKKFCSSACKDKVNNDKKMGVYYGL